MAEPGLGDWMMQMIPGLGQQPQADPYARWPQLPQSPNVQTAPTQPPDPLVYAFPEQRGQAAPMLLPPGASEDPEIPPMMQANPLSIQAGMQDVGTVRPPFRQGAAGPADKLGMLLNARRLADDPPWLADRYNEQDQSHPFQRR